MEAFIESRQFICDISLSTVRAACACLTWILISIVLCILCDAGHRTVDTLLREINLARGQHEAFDAYVDAIVHRATRVFADVVNGQAEARSVVVGLAVALQGSLLLRHAPAYVSHAFCASVGVRVGVLLVHVVSSTLRCIVCLAHNPKVLL